MSWLQALRNADDHQPGVMVERDIRGLDVSPLLKARLKKNLSRAELSRLSGPSASTIEKIETGQTQNPNIETIHNIAKTLGVPMTRMVKVPRQKRTLADWRHLAGKSQTTLARLAGISDQALGSLERGQTQLTPAKAQALAPLLGITENELHAAWQRARDRPPGTPA